MKDILEKSQNIYCVGIGGTGLSALATILRQNGKNISGSDASVSDITKRLEMDGIPVKIGHFNDNLPKDTNLLIYSPAISQTIPERKSATNLGITQLSYPEAVGLISNKMNTIAVCGTHGKTTTTALLASAFINSLKDPTVLLGSAIGEFNNHNARVGKGNDFIIEACEYKRNFLNYKPKIIVLNNIEVDHLDYYLNEKDYFNAFFEFSLSLPKHGSLYANIDDPNIVKLLTKLIDARQDIKIVTFGTHNDAVYKLKDKTIFLKKDTVTELKLQIPGKHNLMNALAAFSVAHNLGLPPDNITAALNGFHGANRRFQILGKLNKALIIDDYAHHPTEIKATLKAAREMYGNDKKILCIFQPHQYSRTKKLLNGFATAFSNADEVIIPNIYGVRDSQADIDSINEEILVKEILKNHQNALYGNGITNTLNLAEKKSRDYDIILILGAGDITNLAHQLVK